MKFLTLPLLLALLWFPAQAQTRIGGVTLTPVDSPRTSPGANSGNAATPRSSAEHNFAPVAAGMRELRGRLTVSREGTRLPAGNQIGVSIHDAQTGRSVIAISFSTTRLSTPYQMIFSPGRIASTRRYVVRAVISDSAGKVLYRSADLALPKDTRATLNIPLSAR